MNYMKYKGGRVVIAFYLQHIVRTLELSPYVRSLWLA